MSGEDFLCGKRLEKSAARGAWCSQNSLEIGPEPLYGVKVIDLVVELENQSKLKDFAALQVDFKKITSFNPPESITCPITDDDLHWDF